MMVTNLNEAGSVTAIDTAFPIAVDFELECILCPWCAGRSGWDAAGDVAHTANIGRACYVGWSSYVGRVGAVQGLMQLTGECFIVLCLRWRLMLLVVLVPTQLRLTINDTTDPLEDIAREVTIIGAPTFGIDICLLAQEGPVCMVWPHILPAQFALGYWPWVSKGLGFLATAEKTQDGACIA